MYIISGGKALQLNRQAVMRACNAVKPLDKDPEPVEGWYVPFIRADKSPVIDVTIGPTGGKKGYQGITGEKGLEFLANAEKCTLNIQGIIPKRSLQTYAQSIHQADQCTL